MKLKYRELTTDMPVARRPLSRYPRPSMVRDSFICLNGKWDDGVTVPFPLESKLSGFSGEIPTEYTYHRTFVLEKSFIKDVVLLHFGAVDQIAEVYIDNVLIGRHEGGYLPFAFDIAEYVVPDKVHTLTVKVTDELSHLYPWGKQKKKRGGMWYTPVTGIWQSVWLESMAKEHIEALEITPSLTGISVNIESEASDFHVEIYDKEQLVFEDDFESPYFKIKLNNPKLWTPDTPNLYDIIIKTAQDEIKSYFGLRTVEISKINGVNRILLNGEPFFFHGVLDQGYFPEGIYTPNDEQMYEDDIRRLKSLGVNTIRKHIKIEPECFYEACDRIGMLVFQDMVNNGTYKFIRDTALPTLHIQKFRDYRFRVPDEVKATFEHNMEMTLSHLYNFPSVVYYTIFNEGWGQFDSDIMYSIVKAMDRSRIIDSTSGWFWQNDSDVDSYHVYFKAFKMKRSDRPVILSEFGGYSMKVADHSFNLKKNYGYGKAASSEDLTDMLEKLYETEIIPAIGEGLCGTIYTQATDVEDETNGFFTYDRKICKVNPERMRSLAKKLVSSPLTLQK